MFWSTTAAFTVATAIVSGTWGLTHPITVQGTAHAASATSAPAATPQLSCWVEKVHSAADAEVICGDPKLRPATDTADIGEVFATQNRCGWAATWTGERGYIVRRVDCV